MESELVPEDLRSGVSVAKVLQAFELACRVPYKTLWITDSWFGPRREKLVERLTDPVTDEEVQALTDSLLRRTPLDYVVDWLAETPRPPWADYHARRQHEAQEEALEPQHRQYRNVMLDIWSRTPDRPTELHLFCRGKKPSRRDRIYRAHKAELLEPCPTCGQPFESLDWRFVELISPFDGARQADGWIALCHECHLLVHDLVPNSTDDYRWFAWRHLGPGDEESIG